MRTPELSDATIADLMGPAFTADQLDPLDYAFIYPTTPALGVPVPAATPTRVRTIKMTV